MIDPRMIPFMTFLFFINKTIAHIIQNKANAVRASVIINSDILKLENMIKGPAMIPVKYPVLPPNFLPINGINPAMNAISKSWTCLAAATFTPKTV